VSLGARIKEERQRLGLNQTDFAALAGASRRAMVNWESDGASPLATALIAWANAGVDAVYILTGRRAAERLPPDDELVEDELKEIERELFEPRRRPGETTAEADTRICAEMAKRLEALARFEAPTPAQEERISALLKCCNDARALETYRVTRASQEKQERDDTQELLELWFANGRYQPDYSVMQMLVMISMEYHVPYKVLVELAQAVQIDLEEQASADCTIERHERGAN
jgi:transcriptional regulator with XRE-family HTH domain